MIQGRRHPNRVRSSYHRAAEAGRQSSGLTLARIVVPHDGEFRGRHAEWEIVGGAAVQSWPSFKASSDEGIIR